MVNNPESDRGNVSTRRHGELVRVFHVKLHRPTTSIHRSRVRSAESTHNPESPLLRTNLSAIRRGLPLRNRLMLETDDPTNVLAGFQVVVTLLHLIERVLPGD